MSSYTPEFYYGAIHDANGRWTGQSGLVPWPAHLRPREPEPLPDVDLKSLFGESSGVELTKKGEAYAEKVLAEAGGVFFVTLSKDDRAGIAYTIERLITLLDDMEPDPDLEPYLAGLHQGSHTDDREGDDGYGGDCDCEPSLGWTAGGHMGQEQPSMFGTDLEADDSDDEHSLGWGIGDQTSLHAQADEREDVSEDEGADIQSQPHDQADEGNDEPFLGWSESQSQYNCVATGDEFDRATDGPLGFDGDGVVAGQQVLRNLQGRRPDVHQNYVGGFCMGSYTALRVEGLSIRSNKDRERFGPDELTILRPGVAMIGGYRDTAVMRAIAPRDEDMIPEIDLLAHYRAVHGPRP